jgi:cbb3-type cytochrome c oxidase subunit I
VASTAYDEAPPAGAGPRSTTAIGFLVSGAAFMVLGATFGLVAGTELIAPDLIHGIREFAFGRMRPMHTNMVMFGFVVTLLLGFAHYVVPRLSKTPLHSEKIGVLSVAVWDLSIVVGEIALALGYTQSKEYAEWFFPTDVGIMIAFGLMIYNLTRTVMARREPLIYVTTWYYLGGLTLSAATYFIGNCMWTGWPGAVYGMEDAVIHWFYGHNVLGLLMTPLAVGAAYYVIPRAARAPLYSHTLSLIGFWSILVMYTHIGTHHLLQTPAPTWLKMVAIVDSIGMLIPVMTVLVNLWMTSLGRLSLISQDIGARFVWAGTILYFMVCVQGPMQALPVVQRITHYTYWVPAHAHLAVLGFVGMIAWGAFYFILPEMTGRPIYSRSLAVMQYWLHLVGVSGKMVVLTAAGLIQGHAWFHGETVYKILPAIWVYNVVRVMMGMLVLTSGLIGLYNMIRSLSSLRAPAAVPAPAPAGPAIEEATA